MWYHQLHQFHEMGHHRHYRENHFLTKSYYHTFLEHCLSVVISDSRTTVQQHGLGTAVLL